MDQIINQIIPGEKAKSADTYCLIARELSPWQEGKVLQLAVSVKRLRYENVDTGEVSMPCVIDVNKEDGLAMENLLTVEGIEEPVQMTGEWRKIL